MFLQRFISALNASLVMYINDLIEGGEIWEKRPVDKLIDERQRQIFIMPGLPVDYYELESVVIVEPEFLKKWLDEYDHGLLIYFKY